MSIVKYRYVFNWYNYNVRRVSRNSQEGGGPKSKSLFFFFFQFFRGGGPAPKLAEKMTISTKKVAKYR